MATGFAHVVMKYRTGKPLPTAFVIDQKTMFELGEKAQDEVRKALNPLRRSGQLDTSWDYISHSSGFSIWSDDWAASSIQLGWKQPPPKSVMIDWMKLKSEFSGLDDKEMSRVAFAIRQSMIKGNRPGAMSTIGPMAPSGQRRFDYFKVVTGKIVQLIRNTFIP